MEYDELSLQEKNDLFRTLIKNGHKFKSINDVTKIYNRFDEEESVNEFKKGGLIPKKTLHYINKYSKKVSNSEDKLTNKIRRAYQNGRYTEQDVSRLLMNGDAKRIKRGIILSRVIQDAGDITPMPNESEYIKGLKQAQKGIDWTIDYFNSPGYRLRFDNETKNYNIQDYDFKRDAEYPIDNTKQYKAELGRVLTGANSDLIFDRDTSILNPYVGAHEMAHHNKMYNTRKDFGDLELPISKYHESPHYGNYYNHIPIKTAKILYPKKKGLDFHDMELSENYSDLMGTRTTLSNLGIFDSRKEGRKFTKKMYRQYKKTHEGDTDRFLNNHSKQQVINALNLVAQNNQGITNDNNINYAAEGGNLNFPNFIQRTRQILMDRNLPSKEELALRQSYAESRFNPTAKSHKGAVGLNQIMPFALQDYNKANKTNYTMKDMENPELNNKVRMHMSHNAYNASWNNMPQSETNKVLKEKVSHNFGKTNLVNKLNGLKKEGYDIYYDTAWLQRIPKESSDYAKFIVFGDSTGVSRNLNSFYEALKQNKELEKMIRKDVQLWNFKK